MIPNSVSIPYSVKAWRWFGVLGSHILLFALVYNISFTKAPSASTGRIAFLFLLWICRYRIQQAVVRFGGAYPITSLVFGAAMLQAAAGYLVWGMADFTQLSRQLHFLIYSIMGSLLYIGSIDYDRDRFLRRFANVAFIQSVFIIYSLFDFEYRVWLSGIVVVGGNMGIAESIRPPGFTNSTGANLSVIQALGVFAALWSAFHSKSKVKAAFFYLFVLAGVVSVFLTGRTGMLLSVTFIIAFCLYSLGKKRVGLTIGMAIPMAGVLLFGPLFVAYLSSLSMENLPNFERLINWALEFFLSGNETNSVQDLGQMPIPQLNWQTIVGTGLVYLDNIRVSGHDSGYIQTYYSLGLLVGAMFYGALAYLVASLWKLDNNKFLLGILSISMFIIEIKEPFIFKYIFPFFLLCLYYPSIQAYHSARHVFPG